MSKPQLYWIPLNDVCPLISSSRELIVAMRPYSIVTVMNDEDPYNLMKGALELAGVRSLIKPEKKIFIKPNLVGVPWDYPYLRSEGVYLNVPWIGPEGYMTRRCVAGSLIRVLKEWGGQHIVVGEGSGGCETPIAFKASGFYELAEHHKIELIDLNYAEAVKVPTPSRLILDYVWIPKILLESDILIDLTTLKLHGTAVSFCLKNWGLGIPPAKYYGFDKSGSSKKGLEGSLPIHRRGGAQIMGQEVAVAKVIVDVCKTLPPHLAIVDGITVVHYAKSTNRVHGKTKIERTNLMIVGTDIVAVDAVTSRIVGINPEKVLHIKLAAEQNLGIIDPSKIEVRGVPIEKVQIKCNPLLSQREILL
jgi:uncharacterized protein (DUF362 family)